MIKGLIKLGLLLVVGLVGYNYFLGDEAEKAQSKEIINKVKEVGQSGVDLVKAEKKKFDAGKYDGALDKIGGIVDNLKSKAKDSKEFLDKIGALEEKKEALQERIGSESEDISEKEQGEINDEMADLMKQIEEVSQSIQEESK